MQGQVIQEKYTDTVCVYKGGSRKAKAHLKSNLAQDMKGNKKGFKRPTNRKSNKRW